MIDTLTKKQVPATGFIIASEVHENNWEIELNLGHYPYPGYEPMAFWGDCQSVY